MYEKKGGKLAIGKENERVAAIIPKIIAKDIKRLAKKDNRSVSSMTAILIKIGLDAFKNK